MLRFQNTCGRSILNTQVCILKIQDDKFNIQECILNIRDTKLNFQVNIMLNFKTVYRKLN